MASRNIGRYGSADYRSERRAQRSGQSLLTSPAAFPQSLAGWPAVNRDLGPGGIQATHFGKNDRLRFSSLRDPKNRLRLVPGCAAWLGWSLGRDGRRGAMSPRRLAAVCGTFVLAGWVAVGLARFAASGINIVAPTEETRATSVAGAAERVEAPRVATIREDGLSRGNAAMVDAVLPRPIPPPGTPVRTPETPLVQVAVVVKAGSMRNAKVTRRVACTTSLPRRRGRRSCSRRSRG